MMPQKGKQTILCATQQIPSSCCIRYTTNQAQQRIKLNTNLHFGLPQFGKSLTHVAQIQGMRMKQICVGGPPQEMLHTTVL
jgi:hypothetical protein